MVFVKGSVLSVHTLVFGKREREMGEMGEETMKVDSFNSQADDASGRAKLHSCNYTNHTIQSLQWRGRVRDAEETGERQRTRA